MKELIKNLIEVENKKLFKSLTTFDSKSRENFINLCTLSIKAIKNGNKIIFYGNGGSASDSQHLATELVVRYQKNRPAISSIALSSDNSMITAIANDFHFKKIFSRQLESIGNNGDVLYAISTSSKSKNVIAALKTARNLKIKTIGVTGSDDSGFKGLCDLTISVPASRPDRIQEMHIAIGQIICEILELELC